MRPRSSVHLTLVRKVATVLAVLVGMSSCERAPAPEQTGSAQAAQTTAVGAAEVTAGAVMPASNAGPGAASHVNRPRELLNPDDSTMVMLYFDLAGIAPRIDDWVEQDSSVQYAPGPEKAGRRATRKAELQGAFAGVRNVGALRLTLDANLSPYDPAYGEFTVRALAPSSVIRYNAFGQKVEVNFTNGLTAQTWKVAPAEAQQIQDRYGGHRPVSLDVLLNVTGVQPAPGGGTVLTEVVEYEMRDSQSGAAITRVRIPGSQT